MKKLRKCIELPSLAMEYVACTLLVLVAIVSLLNVLGRQIIAMPITGAMEIVQFGVLTVMCLALPASTLYGSHARVEFVTERLPFVGKKIMVVITDIVSAVMFIVLIYHMVEPILDAKKRGRTTDVLQIPFHFIQIAIMIGIGLMVLVILYQIIQNLSLNKEGFEKMEEQLRIEEAKREANLDLSDLEDDDEEQPEVVAEAVAEEKSNTDTAVEEDAEAEVKAEADVTPSDSNEGGDVK